MDRAVIEDFYYMTIMDENVSWMKVAHVLVIFGLNLKSIYCTSTFTS